MNSTTRLDLLFIELPLKTMLLNDVKIDRNRSGSRGPSIYTKQNQSQVFHFLSRTNAATKSMKRTTSPQEIKTDN